MADLDLGGSLYLILIEEGTQTGPHCLTGERQFLEAQALLILEVPTWERKPKLHPCGEKPSEIRN